MSAAPGPASVLSAPPRVTITPVATSNAVAHQSVAIGSDFTVGGGGAASWVPLAIVALVALGVLWAGRR